MIIFLYTWQYWSIYSYFIRLTLFLYGNWMSLRCMYVQNFEVNKCIVVEKCMQAYSKKRVAFCSQILKAFKYINNGTIFVQKMCTVILKISFLYVYESQQSQTILIGNKLSLYLCWMTFIPINSVKYFAQIEWTLNQQIQLALCKSNCYFSYTKSTSLHEKICS